MKLPNFLILGANKAGTTSLAYYLSQHPDIFISSVKEPMFFTGLSYNNVPKNKATLDKPYFCYTLQDYLELFFDSDEKFRGEASTAYLANPSCAAWIKKIIPNTKLIVVLRNPIDRALSAYKMYYGNGLEKRTFEEAINFELKYGVDGIPQGRHYLKLGLYASQLKIFKTFFADEQIFFGNYENFNQDAISFLADLFNFLGAESFMPKKLNRLNLAEDHCKNAKPSILFDIDLREKMKKYFENDVLELKKIVPFDTLDWLS